MNRVSDRNIQWNKFKRNQREQLKGFIEAMRFAGKSDAEIIDEIKKIEKPAKDAHK